MLCYVMVGIVVSTTQRWRPIFVCSCRCLMHWGIHLTPNHSSCIRKLPQIQVDLMTYSIEKLLKNLFIYKMNYIIMRMFFRKKREGTGFCVPSTCGGHNVGNAYTVCAKIIRIKAILHEDVFATILATHVYDNASDVGLV